MSGRLSPQRSHPIRRLKGYCPLTFPTKVWSDIIPVATAFFYAPAQLTGTLPVFHVVYPFGMKQNNLSDLQDDPGDYGVWPPVRRRKVVLPLVLFVLTCLSTFWVGVTEWNPTWPSIHIAAAILGPLFEPLLGFDSSASAQRMMNVRLMILENSLTGLTYMGAVLLILFLHEMGHFVATLIYKVPASLPFFLPFPINPIGTLGAVIGMQGYIADRKQIFDIGIAGPIAGLVAAVPIAWFGVAQLDLTTQPYGGLGFRLPLLMQWFAQSSQVPGFSPESVVWLNQLNPLFVAGWVGMLITGLNMMPVGQLDGGHVTYTLFGSVAHKIARLTLVFAIAFMVYHQSFVLVIMVVLLLLVGTDHPPTRDDRVKLGAFRWTLGLVSLVIPVLCFPPLIFEMR